VGGFQGYTLLEPLTLVDKVVGMADEHIKFNIGIYIFFIFAIVDKSFFIRYIHAKFRKLIRFLVEDLKKIQKFSKLHIKLRAT